MHGRGAEICSRSVLWTRRPTCPCSFLLFCCITERELFSLLCESLPPHSEDVLSLFPSLSVCKCMFPHCCVGSPQGYSGFLPQSKDMQLGLTAIICRVNTEKGDMFTVTSEAQCIVFITCLRVTCF